jgi:hypothetical protein
VPRARYALLGAQIGGQLTFAGAQLIQPDNKRPSLYLERAEAVELWLPHQTPPQGIVDLTDARVAQLHDEWRPEKKGQSFRYGLRVNGFEYESLAEDSHARTRLDWIARAEEESARAGGESGYLPRAYDQLEAVFRRAGSEEDARKVAIEKQRRKRTKLRPPASWGNRFLDWTVGYGYRTWRAVYALLGLMALGWGVCASASGGDFRAIRTKRPDFEPWLYSIDTVLPVINLGQETAWSPTVRVLEIWYALSVLAGWVLATAVLAALTATLFRE